MINTIDIKALREALKGCDRNDYRTWPQLPPQRMEWLLDQLEAERQRANESGERFYKAVQYGAKLEAEIEAAGIVVKDGG